MSASYPELRRPAARPGGKPPIDWFRVGELYRGGLPISAIAKDVRVDCNHSTLLEGIRLRIRRGDERFPVRNTNRQKLVSVYILPAVRPNLEIAAERRNTTVEALVFRLVEIVASDPTLIDNILDDQ